MDNRSRSRGSHFLRKPVYRKQRASIACEVCRSRKSKCDGATPRCGFCQKVGAQCNYVPLAEKVEESREEDTQSRLAALELEVQHLHRIVSTIQTSHHQLHSPQAVSGSDSEDRIAANHLRLPRITDNMTANIDFDMTSYLTDLELDVLAPSLSTPTSPHAGLFDAHLMSAFFDRIHNWYPIFDQRSFEAEYLLASTRPFVSSLPSFLYLMVSAIGALTLSLENGAYDDLNEHAAHAFRMLHAVIADHHLIGAQCLLLCAIYHLLCFKPNQAYEYILSASYKVQNLYRRNQGRNMVNTELYRRAFYALYIMEGELLVQLKVAESGISTLAENVSLPSGTFENGNVDSGAIVFFLAEIAMRKMMESTDINLAKNWLSHNKAQSQDELRFAIIIAKEMEFQAAEWRGHLPLNIAFPDSGFCSSDLSLYLQMQYNAQICGINWHALHKATIRKDGSHDIVSACRKCLLSFCAFIDSASDFFSKPIMLPHISMALASVFTISLGMLIGRKAEVSQEIGHLESSFSQAVEVLRRYGTIYPAVEHWADVLEDRLSADLWP